MSNFSLPLSRREQTCCLVISDCISDEHGHKNLPFHCKVLLPPSCYAFPMQWFSLFLCVVFPRVAGVIAPLFTCFSRVSQWPSSCCCKRVLFDSGFASLWKFVRYPFRASIYLDLVQVVDVYFSPTIFTRVFWLSDLTVQILKQFFPSDYTYLQIVPNLRSTMNTKNPILFVYGYSFCLWFTKFTHNFFSV